MAFTATAKGRLFEIHSAKFLNYHLNMSLERVGRAGDEGIDLRGWWWLPRGALRDQSQGGPSSSSSRLALQTLDRNRGGMAENDVTIGNGKGKGKGKAESPEGDVVRIRVVGQCKAESKTLGSRAVRELEGVMAGLRLWDLNRPTETLPDEELNNLESVQSSSHIPSMAILLSQSGFSKGAVTRALTSPAPLMLVHLPGGRGTGSPILDGVGEEGRGMKVTGCLLNHALSGEKGLLSTSLEIRREIVDDDGHHDDGVTRSQVKEQWRCWYNGKRLERLDPTSGSPAESSSQLSGETPTGL